jgi:hypothetical protein
MFLKRKALLEPFRIIHYCTDDWGTYTRHREANVPNYGKRNT